MEDVDFNLFLPLDEQSFEKSSDDHGYFIRGWASTPAKDRDGDIVLPKSLNIKEFIDRGYINYEHKQGDQYKIGVPTKNTFIDPEKGLFVEAKLFMDNQYAKGMWELAQNLAKSGSSRKVGFSIEGKFLGRDYRNPSIIKNVRVKNVALTTNPANTEANWEAFVKSFTTGDDINPETMEGGAALRRQSLAHDIRNLWYNIKDVTDGEWLEVAKSLDEEDRYDEGLATMFLQLSRGLSKEDAERSLKE